MENTKINILDQIDVNSPNTPVNNGVPSVNQEVATTEGSGNPLDFIKKYLTKKNIYILCGIIIIAGLIYYFYLKKSGKKSSEKQNSDINIEVPPSNGTNNHYFVPLPENTPKQMSQEDYNALVQQQLLAQQAQAQAQVQAQAPEEQNVNLVQLNQDAEVVHPGQGLQNIKIEDESEIETPEIDNQKLTADEIKQISDQLQKLQAEGN